MKDYRLFDISDFVIDDDFVRWVIEEKKADNDFWNNWLSENPDKYMAVAEARKILESLKTEEQVISVDERENEINRLLQTISEKTGTVEFTEQDASDRRISISKRRWWYAAAAVLIGVVAISGYILQKQDKGTEQFAYRAVTPSKHLIESVNTSEKTISLKLPDESIVELAPDSRIGYPNNFDSSTTRDVYLSGEAFFRVTKNPARPFRVFANEIVTKVLGTTFSVRCFEKDTVIQVAVRTGKVSVYSQANQVKNSKSNSQPGGIILTPNQELVYKKSEQKFQKNLLAEPVEIAPAAAVQDNMILEEVPLEKVFSMLSKKYEINIVYDTELLKLCTVTADLRNEPFYRKLDLICKAIAANYEIIDGQVVIVTKGCK
jgi:transmembrane sensor